MKNPVHLNVGHVSLQFSDTKEQQRQDVEKIFARAERRRYAWLTGTEASGGNGNADALRAVAPDAGYRLHIPKLGDAWIAVREDLIDGGWDTGYIPVIPGKAGAYAAKGVAHASWVNDDIGPIAVGAVHYLTKGRTPKDPNYDENVALARAIGEWVTEAGRGKGLAFYGGDQNIPDNLYDTFLGQAKLTTLWDELKKWSGTGHGNIDVVATYDKDGRVEGLYIRALSDQGFFLHTDHFLVEAGLSILPL